MRNTIRFDWAIKRLLRNKANFGILEGFLSELLGEDIKIESILESESNKQTIDNKMNQVDMLAQDAKGELIIIEVQSNYTHDFLMRMLFGTSKLVVDNMDKGMVYSEIKKNIR
jgi:predicted transposase/invertase (TIGR01784 family)